MKLHKNLKHRALKHSTNGISYTPTQLATFYGFPKNATGVGKHIAVIELGGGFVQSDLDKYFHSLGLTVKPVVFHSIDGATNSPGDPNGDDGEVMLDLCVIGGMAPGAQMHCYMAPNTDQGFIAAVEQAVIDKMDAISISWGAAEDQWSTASITAFNSTLQQAIAANITVTAAAGDNGSGDGEPGQHVDFPASSPYITGCGGTSLPNPTTEVVWNDGAVGGATGGGISTLFLLPTWQAKANVPGNRWRGVPDVAGNADPYTGWVVIIDGQEYVIGGTSAVAPMWAAIAAVVSSAVGKNLGFLNPILYSIAGWNRDVTQGNNGTYAARPGYDCCTGNGVPVVSKLIAALSAPTPTPTPVPPPTPPPPTPTPAPVHSTHNIVITGSNVSVIVDSKKVV